MHESGHVIINAIISDPETTESERAVLHAIAHRLESAPCTFGDAWRVCRIVWRLLRG